MNGKILSVEDVLRMSQEQLSEMYRQGYTLEGAIQKSGCSSCKSTETLGVVNNSVKTLDIKALAATCLPGSTFRGVPRSITVSVGISIGYAPYKYLLIIDNAEVERYPTSGTTTETSHTFTYDFNKPDKPTGVYVVEGVIIDSCPSLAQGASELCNVTVVECLPISTNMTIT